VQVVEEANRRLDGMSVYAAIDSEMLERLKLAPSSRILSVEKGRNFEMVATLLGRGTELPRDSRKQACLCGLADEPVAEIVQCGEPTADDKGDYPSWSRRRVR
jgi:hypothetical protein